MPSHHINIQFIYLSYVAGNVQEASSTLSNMNTVMFTVASIGQHQTILNKILNIYQVETGHQNIGRIHIITSSISTKSIIKKYKLFKKKKLQIMQEIQ
jgi:hypothetical protein